MNNLVSIIIPVYNGGKYLEMAIDSALQQTYSNIEVLVINDGSNDSGLTEEIAKSYGSRIRYYYKENGGVSSALNYGIKKMKGYWFSWLSHDDLYNESKIEEQIKLMDEFNEQKLICFTKSRLIDGEGKKKQLYINRIKPKYYTPVETLSLLFSGKNFNGCSLLIPKSAFDDCGLFDETLHYIQDWKMWIKFADNDYSFVGVNKILISNRIHAEQQTQKLANILPFEIKKYINEYISKLLNFDVSSKKLMIVYKWSLLNDYTSITDRIESEAKTIKLNMTGIVYKVYYKSISFFASKAKVLINKVRRG